MPSGPFYLLPGHLGLAVVRHRGISAAPGRAAAAKLGRVHVLQTARDEGDVPSRGNPTPIANRLNAGKSGQPEIRQSPLKGPVSEQAPDSRQGGVYSRLRSVNALLGSPLHRTPKDEAGALVVQPGPKGEARAPRAEGRAAEPEGALRNCGDAGLG